MNPMDHVDYSVDDDVQPKLDVQSMTASGKEDHEKPQLKKRSRSGDAGHHHSDVCDNVTISKLEYERLLQIANIFEHVTCHGLGCKKMHTLVKSKI